MYTQKKATFKEKRTAKFLLLQIVHLVVVICKWKALDPAPQII
jgi:hypothetical protein